MPGSSLRARLLKFGILDNYGRILASRDAASLLQGKLRQNEGEIKAQSDDDEDLETESYDQRPLHMP